MPKIRFEPSGIIKDTFAEETVLDAAAGMGIFILAPCGGKGVCRKCVVTINGKEELACTYHVDSDLTVEVKPYHMVGDRSERATSDYILPILKKTFQKKGPFLALDLGTTGVAAMWVDPATGAIRCGKARNRQAIYGADVLSRIFMVEEEGEAGRQTMRELAQQSISEALAQLGAVRPAQNVALSANPTMVYLLLGWNASAIRKNENLALELAPISLQAQTVLGANDRFQPEAKLQILPGAANYLGGDVLAGLALVRYFYPQDKKVLLIDAGTNGEIVLTTEDAVLAVATSAGPAFEGGEVGAGSPANADAIDRVKIPAQDLWAEYSTIGGVSPGGICGSGIIELVAELSKALALERNGRIKKSLSSTAIVRGESGCEYVLVPATATSTGKDIRLSDSDLRAIISTKAAIFAGCRRLAKAMDISFGELDRIFVAGDFGYHINIGSAISIGMLPDIDVCKYTFLGNASLAGAMLSLLTSDFTANIEHLARITTFLDLSNDEEFMDEFMAANFLPHTDETLFPSITKKR